jgi:hypothetical protein
MDAAEKISIHSAETITELIEDAGGFVTQKPTCNAHQNGEHEHGTHGRGTKTWGDRDPGKRLLSHTKGVGLTKALKRLLPG